MLIAGLIFLALFALLALIYLTNFRQWIHREPRKRRR